MSIYRVTGREESVWVRGGHDCYDVDVGGRIGGMRGASFGPHFISIIIIVSKTVETARLGSTGGGREEVPPPPTPNSQ